MSHNHSTHSGSPPPPDDNINPHSTMNTAQPKPKPARGRRGNRGAMAAVQRRIKARLEAQHAEQGEEEEYNEQDFPEEEETGQPVAETEDITQPEDLNASSEVLAQHRILVTLEEQMAAGAMDEEEEVNLEMKINEAARQLRQIKEDERFERSENRDGHFIGDGDSDPSSSEDEAPTSLPPEKGRKRKSRDADNEVLQDEAANHEGADAGDEAKPARKRSKKSKSSSISNSKSKSKLTSAKAKRSKSKKKAVEEPEEPIAGVSGMLNREHMMSTDVFRDHQATAALGDQPTFHVEGTRGKRKQAMTGLVASIQHNNAQSLDDQKMLDSYIDEFYGKGTNVIPVGDGLWMIRGMKTPLKHYQIMGSGFILRREKDSVKPNGGILADQMGLGKTLMMLGAIINNKPPKQKRSSSAQKEPRTTLIVASPNILDQWESEIAKHCEQPQGGQKYGIKKLYRFKASVLGKMIPLVNNQLKNLEKNDIVLTTYHEVSRSYPNADPPAELTTKEQINEWWRHHYEENKGLLHRMHFYRIVLDEAHAIKNPLSITSKACRAIKAKFSWAITGTPVHNTLDEFFPYFKFLGCPNTGSVRTFKSNFCTKDDPDGIERLNAYLSFIMIKRTHSSTLFNSKLLTLPKPTDTIFYVEFNACERAIYNIVRKRCIARINALAKQGGGLQKSYGFVWVMLLRLRQLCSHLLAIQTTIADILETEDWEKIKEISQDQNLLDGECTEQLFYLQQVLANTNTPLEDDQPRDNKDATQFAVNRERATIDIDTDSFEDTDLGGEHGKTYNIQKLLGFLHARQGFAEMEEKTKCMACSEKPHKPQVTSCFHIYCDECLRRVMEKAAMKGMGHARCGCGEAFTGSKAIENDFSDVRDEGSSSGSRKVPIDEDADWISDVKGPVLPSAKTLAVKIQIMRWLEEDSEGKIIIFTQFLPLVRILAKMCLNEGWGTCQYTGKQSHADRAATIKEFEEKSEIKIMLASLKAGGQGLNLTMANRVVILDPWWNQAVEMQAFCRVFRIGQERETSLCRIVVRNTIEENMKKMQLNKLRDINLVMDRQDALREGKKPTLQELLRLFGEVGKDDKGNTFVFAEEDDSLS